MVWSLMLALPAVCNMLLLQAVIIFMFAVFGIALFGNVMVNGNPFLTRTLNFQNMGHAVPLLCLASTLEQWVDFMKGVSFDMVGCEGNTCGMPTTAGIYFHIFIIVSSYVVMNIAVFIVTFNFEGISYSYRVCSQPFTSNHTDCIFARFWRADTGVQGSQDPGTVGDETPFGCGIQERVFH